MVMRCFHPPFNMDFEQCVEMLENGKGAHGQPTKAFIPVVKPRLLDLGSADLMQTHQSMIPVLK